MEIIYAILNDDIDTLYNLYKNFYIDRDILNNKNGLYYAIYYDKLNIVDFFIRNNASLYNLTNNNESALHIAIKENKINIVKYLLLICNDIYIKDNFGNTPIDVAMTFKRNDILNIIKN